MRAVLRVVVAGADVAVAADAVGLVAHDERGLGVHLEPDEAVDDVDARLLQRLAHSMLALSSKRALSSTSTATCLPRSAARMSERTIGLSPDVRYSVILMASTCGSTDGLADELLDRGAERVVGVVHEHVAVAEHGEDVEPLVVAVVEAGRRDPLEHRVLEVGPVEGVHRPQPAEVERAGEAVDVVVVEVELALEQRRGPRR